jgi:hypothetical protein
MISHPISQARPLETAEALRHLWRWPGYALLFLMLFVPTTYQPIKGVLLASTLSIIGLAVLGRGRIALHPQVLAATLSYSAIGLFFVGRGLIDGQPGALRMSTVYVLWPLVYMLMVAGASQPDILKSLFRLLIWITIAVSAYSLHYILWAVGWWPSALYLPLDQGQAFAVYGSYVEFNLYSISTLLFLVPFSLAALLVVPKGPDAPVRRVTIWVALALGFLTTLLTGRRALLVVLAAAPIIGLTFWAFMPQIARRITRKMVRRSAAGAIIIGALLVLYLERVHGLTFEGLIQMVGTGFQFGSDPVARSRAEQFVALISGWEQQPWLGSGHGAPAPGVIRSLEMPWAYELSYVALLYHTGVIGLVLYTAGIGWILWMGLRMVRAGHPLGRLVLPVLVGMCTFLIANATNPYLVKYDYLWIVFLPVAYINCWLLRNLRAADASRAEP